MIIHPDGVYFGLPEAEYHDDPALGASDHKLLVARPTSYWWRSPYAKELRETLTTEKDKEQSTLAQAFGSAVHKIVLEGRAAFETVYWTRPPAPEDILIHREQIREAIRAKTGGKILGSLTHWDHVQEARRAGFIGQTPWGILAEDWEAELAMQAMGRVEISDRWARIMTLIARMIDAPRPDYGGKSQRQHVLTGGMPEVSVFYTDETGLRLKARFDYLRIKSLVDLKTFSAKDDEETIAAFCRSVETFTYDLQAAHYLEIRSKLPALINAGRVFHISGPEPSPTWLRRIAEYDGEVAWIWLTVQTVGLPETDVIDFEPGLIQASASYQLVEARRRFAEYRDKFGMEEPWVTSRGTIKLTDQTFEALGRMRRMQSRGEETYQL